MHCNINYYEEPDLYNSDTNMNNGNNSNAPTAGDCLDGGEQ